jgi:hypothetical protein
VRLLVKINAAILISRPAGALDGMGVLYLMNASYKFGYLLSIEKSVERSVAIDFVVVRDVTFKVKKIR